MMVPGSALARVPVLLPGSALARVPVLLCHKDRYWERVRLLELES